VLIDDNIEKLRETVTLQTPESVCVDVMRRLIGVETPQDDVALLVVRRLAADRRGLDRPTAFVDPFSSDVHSAQPGVSV
jgi:hypothetical protein